MDAPKPKTPEPGQGNAQDHSARFHSELSPSSAVRWMNCPGSVVAVRDIEDTDSFESREGTEAHELAEATLLGNEYEVSDEFPGVTLDAIMPFIDYCRDLSKDGDANTEMRVRYDRWVKDGSGTADFFHISEDGSVVTVVDLKFGQHVKVYADWNPQGMLYALGVLQQEVLFEEEVETVRIVIVQPRLDHISEWDIDASELLGWADDKLAPAALATEDPNAQRVAGEGQCRWCKVKDGCAARANLTLAVASEGFEPFVDEKGGNAFQLNGEQTAAALAKLPIVKKWVDEIQDHGKQLAKAGPDAVPGWKLVAGYGRNGWIDVDKAERSLCRKLTKDVAMPRKLLSPNQAVEAGMPATTVEKLVERSKGNPSLVKTTDKRDAITLTDGFTDGTVDESDSDFD